MPYPPLPENLQRKTREDFENLSDKERQDLIAEMKMVNFYTAAFLAALKGSTFAALLIVASENTNEAAVRELLEEVAETSKKTFFKN